MRPASAAVSALAGLAVAALVALDPPGCLLPRRRLRPAEVVVAAVND
jgi:hypothetical protein